MTVQMPFQIPIAKARQTIGVFDQKPLKFMMFRHGQQLLKLFAILIDARCLLLKDVNDLIPVVCCIVFHAFSLAL